MGRQIKHIVALSPEEKIRLVEMSRDNSLTARSSKHVLILLALDDKKETHLNYRQIAAALHVSATSVSKTAHDYALHGLDYTLSHHYNPASRRKAKVNGELEAYVIQLACGKAPEGYADWTLELLTREANKKGVAEPVSKETIRVMLKKMDSSPGQMSTGASPLKRTLPS